MILTIYLIGVVFSYLIFKIYIRDEKDNKWEDVKINMLVSLCSWISFIYGLLMIIREKLPKNPPKWL